MCKHHAKDLIKTDRYFIDSPEHDNCVFCIIDDPKNEKRNEPRTNRAILFCVKNAYLSTTEKGSSASLTIV